MNNTLVILFCFFSMSLVAQVESEINRSVLDSLPQRTTSQGNKASNKKPKKADIKQYQIISIENDTTYVDTTLSIKKEYKFNYLRQDNFGLIPFHNVGQTYNKLSYESDDSYSMPQFGSRARHFNYMEIEDINTYRVPTPLTELFYKTTLTQGQILDAFFTVNTSPQFNTSIAYKGMRSIGKYLHSLTSTGNFRFTASYNTKNKRYFAKGHIVMQDLLNEENGGLSEDQIPLFESGDDEFKDRSVLEVNFQDAESILKGKRFYLNHFYKILGSGGSKSNLLNIEHTLYFEDKYFEYRQSTANAIFGDAFLNSNIEERETLEHVYNKLGVNYENALLGKINLGLTHNNYNYGYDEVVFLDGQSIPNRLTGDIIGAEGSFSKSIGSFTVFASAGLNLTGDFTANFIKGSAAYQFSNDIKFEIKASNQTKVPNYNVLLHQSAYKSYNWVTDFNTIKTKEFALDLESNKWGTLELSYNSITDYVYFSTNTLGEVKPFQTSETINYLKVKLENEFKFWKFALNNTVLYQNSNASNSVFNVPEIVTRNTLYFTDKLFKKALFLQTGMTFNYFTEYNADAYDPVLAEFYTQQDEKIGGYPRLDFFINAKVSQTRIYFKAEHFNAAFTGYNYYSAPNYPYRDFTVRFGIVWNFFL